nr:MAG TPA: hypothetical protein [Caudoviricetes sp.]
MHLSQALFGIPFRMLPTLLIIPWASTPNSLMRGWKTSLVFSLLSYCQKNIIVCIYFKFAK